MTSIPPHFDTHIPQLIDQYFHNCVNSGPGALCVSFTAETGNCDCYYVTLDKGPPELKDNYEKMTKECDETKERIVVIIFHDSDKSFVEGQPQCFKVKIHENEELVKNEEN